MKPGSLLACLVLAVALVPASCRDSIAPERRLTAVGSAFDGSPDGNYLQLIDRPAVGTDGSPFLLPEFAPVPEPEVEPVKLLVPVAEPAPEPAAAAPPPQQSKSLGTEVGQAAAGVGEGFVEAGKSVAEGAAAVADAAGNAVADALDTVADVFRGRRRHLLQTTASPPQTEQPQVAAAAAAAAAAADLDSPVPFNAALLQPALQPFLPPGEQGRVLLQELAAELAPTVAAALNTTREQLNDLLDVLDSFIPVGATDAEASLIEAGPAFMAAIEGPLNDTAESLARWFRAGFCAGCDASGVGRGLRRPYSCRVSDRRFQPPSPPQPASGKLQGCWHQLAPHATWTLSSAVKRGMQAIAQGIREPACEHVSWADKDAAAPAADAEHS